jgi:tetratricopeptide (TPR) repeat protein
LAEALDLAPQERALFESAASRPPRRQQTADTPLETADSPDVQPPPYAQMAQPWASSPPALVGRAQEMAWVQREITAGRPLPLLSGEPGIGKSRLLREAMSWARGRGWHVLSGGCRWNSGQEPYAPLVDALDRSIRSLQPERQRASLEGCGWLTRLLPELAEAGHGLSVPTGLSSPQERRQMFIAVERYLANISGRAGTLLALDDLQWAGADALDLLAHLIRSTRIRRLRILGAFRSTEAQPGSALSTFMDHLAREDLVGQFELGPLEPQEALALAGEMVGGEESALAARVVERSGGVPFYLVSYARWAQTLGEGIDQHDPGGPAASARSALRRSGDPARARSQRMSGARWEVPWVVKQSIRERVAALPVPAQELLDVAAVIGQQASGAVLAAGADQPEAETITSLEMACQAGLLAEDDERGQLERYRFAHDLIRDVVEADLSAGRQTFLHRRVAVALEQRLQHGTAAGQANQQVNHVNDRALAQVAYHYARADAPEQEARYLRLAGDHARRVYAHQEAAQHYQGLIACLDRLQMRREAAQARKDLAVELARVGRFSEAVTPLDEAEQICRELGDVEAQALVTMVSGQFHVVLGASDKGLALVQPLVEAYFGAEPLGSAASSALPAPVAAQLQGALSGLLFMAGYYRDALQAAERAVELAQATGDARLLARQRLNLGVALFTVGRLVEATERLKEAIAGAEAVDDLDTLAEAFRMASWVYQTRGMFAESRAVQTRGLAVAQQLGDVVGLGHILFLDALLAFYTGDWESARAIAQNSLAVFSQLDSTHLTAYPPLGLGWLSTIEGDRDTGERYLAQAEEIAGKSGPAQVLRFITALRAECELLDGRAGAANERLTPWFSGEPMQERTRLELSVLRAWAAVELGAAAGAETAEAAETLVAETVEGARSADMRLVLPDALRVQALWAMRRRKWDEAEAALEEAITLCRNMLYRYAEAKALYVSGQLWAAKGELAQARARFVEARTICHHLGERLYGDAIEQALATVNTVTPAPGK